MVAAGVPVHPAKNTHAAVPRHLVRPVIHLQYNPVPAAPSQQDHQAA